MNRLLVVSNSTIGLVFTNLGWVPNVHNKRKVPDLMKNIFSMLVLRTLIGGKFFERPIRKLERNKV